MRIRIVRCAYCGAPIREGEKAIRRRGYTGFWCSVGCFLRDTGFGSIETVTDRLVQEDRETNGVEWDEEEMG